jgi:hypothetical protein
MIMNTMTKDYTQIVSIDGEQIQYSRHDLFQEAQRHTHFRGGKKGVLNFLPSIDEGNVLRDLVQVRGITKDTLFKWLIEKMRDVADYGDDWREVKENCEGEFYVALQELDEIKALFLESLKEHEPLPTAY